jgi:glycosyltransferase involved in cell wall biosynthesis
MIYAEQYNVDETKLFFFPYAVHFPEKSRMDPINMKREEELRNGGSLPRILVSNSFYRRKGYEVLLDAFRELAAAGILDNFEITLAGAGEDYDYYRDRFTAISTRIAFPGWLEYDRYIHEMENTDIYIHPSLFEPFGIPPIEAMARGKLCIVSDGVQSTSMIIDNGKNGYVYPASDARQLADIIKKLNIEDIYKIGRNASLTASEKYSYKIYSNVLHICLS